MHHTFSREERLKRRSDFRRCVRQGARAAGDYVVVYVAANELGVTRLGAGSTRRLGNAVARNRAKRLVREAFRLSKADLPTGVDMVVVPRIPWSHPTLEKVKTDLVRTARRAAEELGGQV